MGEHTRLSEVDGGPFLDHDLILYNKLRAAAHRYPDDVAIVSCHQRPDFSKLDNESDINSDHSLRWTFRELWKRSEDLAKALLECGIPADKRMAVFLRNQAEWVLAFWTSLILGTGFVAMHPVLTDSPVELKHQLAIAQPGTILVADVETAEALGKLVPQLTDDVCLKIVASGDENKHGWTSLHQVLQPDVSSVVLPAVQRSPGRRMHFILY
jgi:acyl-CoA synthetase (AMP-forming)/AMP-acid ligase II